MARSGGSTVGQALRRRWWVVCVVVATALVAAWLYTARQEPVYRARSTMVVRPSSRLESSADILRGLDTLERRSVIATFARMAEAASTRDSVARQLNLDDSVVRANHISGAVVPNTNIIRIEVMGPDGNLVAEIANAAASKTRREARRLYRIFALDDLEAATPARRPIYPDPQRNYVAASILGLFLGIGAAIAFDRLARRPTDG